jgi:hypothetical protein
MKEERLTHELKTRLPKDHKIALQVMADLRYLKLSDILREAIREKIERDIEQKAASR